LSDDITVKDVMKSIFDYPHVPYWFSIGQAAKIIKVSFLKTKKYYSKMAVLVFDEKYNLIGILTLRNVLKSINPGLLTLCDDTQRDDGRLLSTVSHGGIAGSKESKERPVSEIMAPTKIFVGPDETLARAACIMLKNDLALLPVMEDGKKLAGLVSIADIFDGITSEALKE
jgi:CBS domain-containing protein